VASRGTTFAKQDRDRAKKAKAAEKRERRESREQKDSAQDLQPLPEGELSAEQLLRLVEELHEAFADNRIAFEEFEERKADLMARLTVS